MKSIKKQAKEAVKNTHPLFESIRESTGESVSVYVQNDMLDMFEAGANYVLEEIQSCIDRHEDGCLALEAIILTIDELKE